jgi:galactokinase
MIKSFDLLTIKSEIYSDHFRNVFSSLYGDNNETLSDQSERYLRLGGLFTKQYPGIGSFRIFSAPGRIEIAGNHTDHQAAQWSVLQSTWMSSHSLRHNDENIIRVKSEGHSSYDVIDLSVIEPQDRERLHPQLL